MKFLGIDFGTKNIGLAISDETGTFARELEILNPKDFWKKMPILVEEEAIETIVVGLPLGIEGNDTEKTLEVRAFAEKLSSQMHLKTEFMDERFSSSMAHNLPGGNSNVDSLAAQIILQNYLDRKKAISN